VAPADEARAFIEIAAPALVGLTEALLADA
jgi:hypothetical protein